METINIKFDEKQLEEVVKKITEKLKENKDNFYELSDTGRKEQNKRVRVYLEANESGVDSKLKRVYWGSVHNTLNNKYATIFNLERKRERAEVEELKKQGWREEVVYK